MRSRSYRHALARAVRDLRAGRLQSDVQEQAGLGRNFLSQLETGRSDPRVSSIVRLARALDVTPAELFARAESGESYDGSTFDRLAGAAPSSSSGESGERASETTASPSSTDGDGRGLRKWDVYSGEVEDVGSTVEATSALLAVEAWIREHDYPAEVGEALFARPLDARWAFKLQRDGTLRQVLTPRVRELPAGETGDTIAEWLLRRESARTVLEFFREFEAQMPGGEAMVAALRTVAARLPAGEPAVPGEAREVVHIARCSEHGLHGERTECFVCRGPVEQVAMVALDPAPPVPGEAPSEETRA